MSDLERFQFERVMTHETRDRRTIATIAVGLVAVLAFVVIAVATCM